MSGRRNFIQLDRQLIFFEQQELDDLVPDTIFRKSDMRLILRHWRHEWKAVLGLMRRLDINASSVQGDK